MIPCMISALIGLAAIAAGVLVASRMGWIRLPAVRDARGLPYRKREYFFSRAERSFYEVLRGAVGNDLIIFAKVRLLDLIDVPRGTMEWQKHKNRVHSKHVDFVLCDRERIAPLLVIELDDASHARADRQQRDAFVDQALTAGGLAVIRITAKRAYDQRALAVNIRERIGAAVAERV